MNNTGMGERVNACCIHGEGGASKAFSYFFSNEKLGTNIDYNCVEI